MRHRVDIIEDDELTRDMIELHLRKNDFVVRCFPSAEAFLEVFPEDLRDLIILDYLLPGLSGEQLLERLRETGDDTPVLMLTVKKDIPTRISTFRAGVDDYMTKPFHMEELLERAKAVIRRSLGRRRIHSSWIFFINNFKVDTESRICDSNKGEVLLSDKEVSLLRYLKEHSHETLTRADILEDVWGMDVAPTPRTVDNFILKFRKLFEDNPDRPKHFLSLRGRGYRFED